MMKKKIINKIIAFSNYLGNNCFLNIENIDNLKLKKKVVFYTLAWGDLLDIYFKYTLPSILHKSNYMRLKEDGFDLHFMLYTIDESEFIQKKYKTQIKKVVTNQFEIRKFNKDSDLVPVIANKSLKEILKYCLDSQSIMFMAPPDTIFANSSIYNSISFAYFKKKSFASAHPRINTKFLNDFKEYPDNGFDSTEMVNFAFRNSHSNFKLANEKLNLNTVHAGISYREISKNLFAITSNMPTTFVVIPTLEDIKFFKTSGSFNDWDRGWLSTLLKKNRVKISGSSDMFFCIEITNDNQILKPKKVKYPWKDLYSKVFANRLSNTFISIWRR